jgi:hypothetical protein
MPERLQSLKNLRTWRVSRDRDLTIGKQLGSVVRAAATSQRRNSGGVAAWESAAPAHLRRLCEVGCTPGGVLTIKVKNAAARFQLDRWLRSGGEASLRSGGVKKVKLT